MKLDGFEGLRQLHAGGQAQVHRARRLSDGQAVILKQMRTSYPTGPQRARFRREFDLLQRVEGQGVVRALDWLDAGRSPVMVLEDFGGASLERCFERGPPALGQALDLAIATVEALGRVHDARLLHLDLNPSNIVYAEKSQELKLIDFGLSIDLPRQPATLQADRVLQGTPRFASPEQTGRMNRSVDYRSDFYSLGATLYWLFTGQAPFVSEDLLELVHAHIVRRPTPPEERVPELGSGLSGVILKLMEKSAEGRYQSTFGILWDLQRCKVLGVGANFEAGTHDRPARFSIPERLYGRVDDLEVLFSAFDRTREGAREVVLVTGASGMGKSALVGELQRPISKRRSLYVAGKFDEFNRDIPYASLGDAMRRFVRMLLTEQHGEVDDWRRRITESVGVNGGLLTQLIPELELIIGEQVTVEALPPLEAEGRLHLTMRRFMRLLANSEHPLVLFMDDLQWADLPSIQLLRVLATDPACSHLLFIGAYRDEDVAVGHPLRNLREELTAEGVHVSELRVEPLEQDHIASLLSDTLRLPSEALQELAGWCLDKTAGNPFFVHRFLYALVEEDLLRFESGTGTWVWDLDGILAQKVTDNVGEFLATRLQRLDEGALRKLIAAACISAAFSARELAHALETSFEGVLEDLKEPLIEGLLEESPIGEGRDGDRRFRFMHDHIQQAARSAAEPGLRLQVHQRVGAMLLGETEAPESAPRLFEIVAHVNAGIGQFPTPEALAQQISLNLAAGKRAMAASAYAPARAYLQTALEGLARGGGAWERAPERMRELVVRNATVACVQGDYERMDALVDEAVAHARDELDTIRALRVRIDALISRLRPEDALRVGLQAMERIDVHLPWAPTEADIGAGLHATFARLEGGDLAEIATRPPPADASSVLAMEMLCVLAPPAYFFNQALLPLLGVELVRLTLESGPTASSSYGFALLGLVLCDLGHVDQGYAFGQLAARLSARFPDKRMRVRSSHVYYGFARHWKEPASDFLGDYHKCFELAMDVGDFEYAGYAGMMHTILGFYMADDLHRLARSAQDYAEAMEETKQQNSLAIHGILHQATLNLLGAPEDPVVLTGEAYNEPQMLALFKELNDPTCLFVIHCIKSVLAGMHGEWARCLTLAEQSRVHTLGAAGTLHKVLLEQWHALAALALATGPEDAAFTRAEACLVKLETWAGHNPSAHGHRPVLIRARLAQVRGESTAALQGYDEAARMARRHRRVADEAVAQQLAAELAMDLGMQIAARACLVEAHKAFQRLGANSCLQALERKHPVVRGLRAQGEGRRLDATQSMTGSVDIDVEALIRASVAVAKERNPTRLVESIVRVSMEGSGASRCLLLTPMDGGLGVSATGTLSEPAQVLETPQALVGSGLGPEGLIRLVARTREAVVLDDATADDLVLSDPYVTANEVHSVLCLPVEQQGRLMAVLYLEHPKVIGAFTKKTVAVLRVLLAQAAIASENAVLIDTLEEKVRARTQELAAASEAKSVFLRSMSHELRTPLNGILGYAQLLLDRPDNDRKQQEALSTIQNSGQHLLSLINDILDMNKIEAGALELVSAPTKLQGFVEMVSALFKPEANRKGLVLSVECDSALPEWISVDARRLRQILLNLIGNALKFTAQGRVKVRTQALAGDRMRVQVSDTGPGIAQGRVATIFEPFKQAGPSHQRAKGTGLGLAIAREIAQQMGGTLGVESVEGEGTTFTLQVPLIRCAASGETSEPEIPTVPEPSDGVVFEAWPDAEVLQSLMDLVDQGDLSALAREGHALGESVPELKPFGEHLARLARSFDDAAIESLIEEGLAQNP